MTHTQDSFNFWMCDYYSKHLLLKNVVLLIIILITSIERINNTELFQAICINGYAYTKEQVG